ncbi:unnamed protein product [Eretmochelys imbricata]
MGARVSLGIGRRLLHISNREESSSQPLRNIKGSSGSGGLKTSKDRCFVLVCGLLIPTPEPPWTKVSKVRRHS